MALRRVRLGDHLRPAGPAGASADGVAPPEPPRPAGTASAPADPALRRAFERIHEEFDVPGPFAPEVEAEAAAAVAAVAASPAGRDETAVPFFTIDPAGSMDLDQAMHLSADGDGFRVRYAIADVPAFVRPGGAVDAEARRRVETLYLPGERAPLHPPVLAEDGASLLPDRVRPAFVWDLLLDAAGEVRTAQVYRARVRSVARFDYTQVQAELDSGSPREEFALLARIGTLRHEGLRARGGADLPMPEQEIDLVDGRYVLSFRPPVPAEDHNAQISLMTGMVAADMMLSAGVGILRTMPAPEPGAVAQVRRQAQALGIAWPEGMGHGRFLDTLDREDPTHLALIQEATVLFRGAGYTPVLGSAPEHVTHAAVAAPYAHVTAPLRRLVDRFGLLVCAAISEGSPVPDDVRAALAELPELMRAGDRRAAAVDRACTDAVEAAVLASRRDEEFDGMVVDDRGEKGCLVQLVDPAVLATCRGSHPEGVRVRVRVARADVVERRVELEVVAPE